MSKNLYEIREKVKGLAVAGRAKNALVSASRGLNRHAAREAKKGIGDAARIWLLAYAVLRGVPYESLEKTTRTTAWRMKHILDEVSGIVLEHRPEAGEDAVTDWYRAEQVAP